MIITAHSSSPPFDVRSGYTYGQVYGRMKVSTTNFGNSSLLKDFFYMYTPHKLCLWRVYCFYVVRPCVRASLLPYRFVSLIS